MLYVLQAYCSEHPGLKTVVIKNRKILSNIPQPLKNGKEENWEVQSESNHTSDAPIIERTASTLLTRPGKIKG